jgi:F-type H+-transporting ATPase subunit c
MKRFSSMALLTMVALLAASPLFAQAEAAAHGGDAKWIVISACFGMAIASSLCALAQGKAISAACEGLARNPGAAPAIRFALLLGLVLIESLALYTLLIIFLKTA